MAATFPTYGLSTNSAVLPDHGVAEDMTDDGEMHLRTLYGTPRYLLQIEVELLENAEAEALLSFLATNRTSEIDITVGLHTYRVRLGAKDPVPRWISGTRRTIRFEARGVRL